MPKLGAFELAMVSAIIAPVLAWGGVGNVWFPSKTRERHVSRTLNATSTIPKLKKTLGEKVLAGPIINCNSTVCIYIYIHINIDSMQ